MKTSIAALAAIVLSFAGFGAAAAPATNFNNDTTSDLLYRNVATGQVYRMLMNGFTVVNGAMAYTEPDTNWKVIADADFNGDGVTDLLWRNDVNGGVYMQPFAVAGLPLPGTIFYTEPNPAWKIVATPDFDGDGKADLLWWNAGTGQLYGMVMNGATITAQGMIYTEPDTVWQVVATGDFAGSGKRNQLVYRNASNGQVYLMTVNFTGSVFSQTGTLIYTEPDTNWKIIHAADFNGDGKTDLLWRNEANGQVYMMLMNNGAIASAGLVYSEPNLQWKVAAVGDYNGDGKADLLFRNEATGTLFQAQMNGLAISNQAIIYQEPNIGWKIMGAWEYQGNGQLYPWKTWTPQIPAVRPSTTGFTYYVDGTNGANTNNGKSPIAAFKTIAKALSVLAAGDTILIRKGLYRESLDMTTGTGVSGTALKPITVGSYGDGEVIIDGSAKVTGWTNVTGTVWQATPGFAPLGIVVNDVPLRQIRQGQGGSTAPVQTIAAGVTSGSGKWGVAGGVLTADFGTTIGAGNPNNVGDIVVPNTNGAQQHVFWFQQNFITFKGLTIRGSGSNGLWGYGKNITVDSCNVKFNGKAGISYLNESSPGVVNSDNAVLYSHVYQNVLGNWPRGNNGNAEAGGGWPGTVVWDTNLRPLARGNIVHMNGGEGVISYGTSSGHTSGSALFEQNIIYDNWSVNLYFDNQPNDVARENFIFNHPPNPADWLYDTGYPYNEIAKFSVCLMLADEQNSSDSTNGFANLANSQVYNNILAGCRIGIRDYSEGAQTVPNHGLKNTLIANNSIIMSNASYLNSSVYGLYLQDNGAKNTGSVIQNNMVQGFNTDAIFFTEATGAMAGINVDYNGYFSTAPLPFGRGFNTVTFYTFAGWKTATPGSDTHSIFGSPLLVDPLGFRATGTGVYEYFKATLLPNSPLQAAGGAQTYTPTVNFSHVPRAVWGIGAQ